MKLGKWRIEYDLAHGLVDILFDGKMLIPNAFAEVRLPQAVTSMDYQTRKVTHEGDSRRLRARREIRGRIIRWQGGQNDSNVLAV